MFGFCDVLLSLTYIWEYTEFVCVEKSKVKTTNYLFLGRAVPNFEASHFNIFSKKNLLLFIKLQIYPMKKDLSALLWEPQTGRQAENSASVL